MVLGGALLAVAVIWALLHAGHDQNPATPVAATSAGPSGSAPASTSGGSPAPIPTGRQELLSYVYERAHDPTVAEDIVRSDGSTLQCPQVPPGTAPQDRLRSYVTSTFPRMQVLDIARIIDKFAGLCTIELRARDDTGTVLVVRIVSPLDEAAVVAPRVDEGSELTNGAFTRFVRVTGNGGWIVTVGSSGPADAGPATSTLLTVARQRDLLW